MSEFDDLKAIQRKLEAVLGEQLFWAEGLESLDTLVKNGKNSNKDRYFKL